MSKNLFGEAIRPHADLSEASGANGFQYRRQFGVVVICKGEAEQARTYEALRKQGFALRVVAV